MMTMATPLSAVSTTLDVSCLSCVSALHCIGLRLLWLFCCMLCCLSRLCSILQASPTLQLKPSSIPSSPTTIPLPALNSHSSPHPTPIPPNCLLQVRDHVLFLISIKCRGLKHPQNTPKTPPLIIQTLCHTAAPSR